MNQRLFRTAKLARGLFYTYVSKRPSYEASTYWDKSFYQTGVSDAKTLAGSDLYSDSMASYHYASIETLSHRMCVEDRFSFEGKTILDVGSGSGHWVDFYYRHGAGKVIACDISEKCCDVLRSRFPETEVIQGTAQDVKQNVDVVNAIGVMFHIAADKDWVDTVKHLEQISDRMIVGGGFGLFTVNYQWNTEREATKRLRSRRYWKSVLSKSCRVMKNPAFAKVGQALPHSNLLIVHS